MTERRAMGAVDAIWLSMDSPENIMVIDGIISLEGPVDANRLEAVIQRRLADAYPAFRQRVVEPATPLGMPHWEDDEDFSIEHHLHHVQLPEPADQGVLQAFIESKMQEPLDRRRPLWALYVIDGQEGGVVVLARFHHALADGIALTQVLLSLTDEDPDGDLAVIGQPRGTLAADPVLTDLTSAARRPSAPASAGVLPGRPRLAEMTAALNPADAVKALHTLWQAGQVANKLVLGHNPQSPLSGAPGVAKRAVWTEPRTLSDIKVVARAAGATVNDIVIAAVSAAIAEYVRARGGDPRDLSTMVPVNVRDVGQPLPPELGNKFALVILPLPTSPHATLERLAETKRRMDAIKRSPEAVLTFALINAIGHLNTHIARQVIDFFASKAIGVTTNVVGPTTSRYLAGARISGILGWVPVSRRQTLGVCIFSYNGVVRVGFKVDAGVITEPELLVQALDVQMDTLVRLAAAV